MSETAKTRGQQMDAGVALLGNLLERNPELMALGVKWPETRTVIGNLFLDVISFTAQDLTEDELMECWRLAVTDYVMRAQQIKEETPDRSKSADEILKKGAAWDGPISKSTS
jgi:hypothetical protein